MGELMCYLVDNMQTSTNSLKKIFKTLKRQSGFNRSVVAFSVMLTAYAVLVEIRDYEQSIKIQELTKRIEELELAKGG